MLEEAVSDSPASDNVIINLYALIVSLGVLATSIVC